jgi:hypothetical protein
MRIVYFLTKILIALPDLYPIKANTAVCGEFMRQEDHSHIVTIQLKAGTG